MCTSYFLLPVLENGSFWSVWLKVHFKNEWCLWRKAPCNLNGKIFHTSFYWNSCCTANKYWGRKLLFQPPAPRSLTLATLPSPTRRNKTTLEKNGSLYLSPFALSLGGGKRVRGLRLGTLPPLFLELVTVLTLSLWTKLALPSGHRRGQLWHYGVCWILRFFVWTIDPAASCVCWPQNHLLIFCGCFRHLCCFLFKSCWDFVNDADMWIRMCVFCFFTACRKKTLQMQWRVRFWVAEWHNLWNAVGSFWVLCDN